VIYRAEGREGKNFLRKFQNMTNIVSIGLANRRRGLCVRAFGAANKWDTVSGSGLSGKTTLTTGTGTLTGGINLHVDVPTAFSAAPNGVVALNGAAIADLEWATSTSALTLSVTAALAPSTTYTIGYPAFLKGQDEHHD